MHILTIDGSFFAQRMLHVGEGFTFMKNPPKERADFKKALITALCNEVRTIGTLSHVIFGLDSRSWRKDFKQVYPLTTSKLEEKQDYKKNRENVEKTYDSKIYYEVYNEFVELIKTKYNVQIVHAKGAEADDVCSIVSQKLTSVSEDIYVTTWSSDGDYPQFVSKQISMIKLPQKKIYRPIKEHDSSMLSVFGKKPEKYVQQLIEAHNGLVEYINPKWVSMYKSILGDGKDNVPCTWTWPSSTGTRFYSITPKHLVGALEILGTSKEKITEDDLYDIAFIEKIYNELMILTKQYVRLKSYDKKIHKAADIRLLFNVNDDHSEIKNLSDYDEYMKEFRDMVQHSLKVYESNRKMKVLNTKEIPEEVVAGILESLKTSSKGMANIGILSNTTAALQMVNLQETTSYFDMFNLKK